MTNEYLWMSLAQRRRLRRVSLSHFYDRFLLLIRLEGEKILVRGLKERAILPSMAMNKSCANMM